MNDSDIIIKKARGFAGLLANIMGPLNDNPKFKEAFKKTQRTFLINASNLDFAAILIIDHGTLTIHSVPNKPKSNLKKKVIGWDGFISMDTMTFLGLAMKRISIIKVGFKWIFGNVKMKGVFKLMSMLKLFDLLG